MNLSRKDIFRLLPATLALGWLWLTVINHLRVEWSVNEQYSYGWAVPFLCCFLVWRRLQSPEHGAGKSMLAGAESTGAAWLPITLLALLALAYGPLRLIEEANPEWRLTSWALALTAVGMTLGFVRLARCGQWRELAFPVAYFLIAVPWPTFLEQPIIQALTRMNAAVSVELLGVLGVPALQRGNLIEIGNGVLGIDEACSGIRSFQATLMLSLFFGELYRFKWGKRIGLCVSGVGLAMAFNLVRTTLLVIVASKQGVAAVSRWHDPAGMTILIACFISLWLVSLWMMRRSPAATAPETGSGTAPSALPVRSGLAALGSALFLWLIVVEVGTELWYRTHESRLPSALTWRIEYPTSEPTYRDLPIAARTKQLLRYDEGASATWRGADQTRWQAVFLRWNPGRVAVHLAKSHTPQTCLPAAGKEVTDVSAVKFFEASGVRLPFRVYRVQDEIMSAYVFYCLWEDRSEERTFDAQAMTYASRLTPVLEGWRNRGGRSLEIVLGGISDAAEAEAAFAAQLKKLIRVEADAREKLKR